MYTIHVHVCVSDFKMMLINFGLFAPQINIRQKKYDKTLSFDEAYEEIIVLQKTNIFL